MSDELNELSSVPPNTQSMEPSVESPVDPPKLPPVLPPRPSKKKGSWLPTVIVILLLMAGITALGVIMIFAIMNDGWRAVLRAVEKDGWEWVWKVTLIGTCGLFAFYSRCWSPSVARRTSANCSADSAKGRPPVNPIPATDHSFVFTSAQTGLTFPSHEWN